MLVSANNRWSTNSTFVSLLFPVSKTWVCIIRGLYGACYMSSSAARPQGQIFSCRCMPSSRCRSFYGKSLNHLLIGSKQGELTILILALRLRGIIPRQHSQLAIVEIHRITNSRRRLAEVLMARGRFPLAASLPSDEMCIPALPQMSMVAQKSFVDAEDLVAE